MDHSQTPTTAEEYPILAIGISSDEPSQEVLPVEETDENAADGQQSLVVDVPLQEEQPEAPAEPSQDASFTIPVDTDDKHVQDEQTEAILVFSHPVKRDQKKRKTKKFYLLLCLLFLGGTSLSTLAVVGLHTYQTYNTEYHQDIALAQAAAQHLQTAEKLLAAYPHNPLNADTILQAQKEFKGALTNFTLVNQSLHSLPDGSTSIPVYGSKLRAALDILPVAIEASQIGIVGCATLIFIISRFHNPLIQGTRGLSTGDITTITHNFQQIEATFSLITNQVNHLSPGDAQLDPRIGKLLAAFHKYLPSIQSALGDIRQLLPIIPALLGIGKPTYYMVEILDSTELRPGGGFIGNYGILTFSGGRLADAHITDVDLLDRPFEATGHAIPYPATYRWFDIAPGSWSLRDANLDADFPTVARYSQANYHLEGGKVSFQGVFAITPALIQHILAITGPIKVPEYHEVITAQNLIDRIHYYQLVASQGVDTISASDGLSSQRKHFTALLAEHFLARVQQLGPSGVSKLIQLANSSIHTKDLQVYLNSSVAESYFQRYHLDAAIQSPPGDGLFVVDANIGVDKANSYITYTLDDQATIDAQGDITHRTTLTYAWTIPGPGYGGSPLYRDYARVYVPTGSILHSQSGWQPRGASLAFGRTVWTGFFTLTFGQKLTITLVWTAPHAVTQDAQGWHYQYLIQRQAGVQWTVHLHLALPPCAIPRHISSPLVYKQQQVTIPITSLVQDTNLDINYTIDCLNAPTR